MRFILVVGVEFGLFRRLAMAFISMDYISFISYLFNTLIRNSWIQKFCYGLQWETFSCCVFAPHLALESGASWLYFALF